MLKEAQTNDVGMYQISSEHKVLKNLESESNTLLRADSSGTTHLFNGLQRFSSRATIKTLTIMPSRSKEIELQA